MSTLCRAFVYLPNHLRTPESSERTVFFDAPSAAFTSSQRYTHLAALLSLAWGVPVAALQEEGVIYNLATERELAEEWGHDSPGDLKLLEISSGGEPEWERNILLPGARVAVGFARAVDVDIFAQPRNSARLRKALATVEDLYAAKERGAA